MAQVDNTDQASGGVETTRERIVQAARELVVEHGYEGVHRRDGWSPDSYSASAAASSSPASVSTPSAISWS
jgi:hypothetical protein